MQVQNTAAVSTNPTPQRPEAVPGIFTPPTPAPAPGPVVMSPHLLNRPQMEAVINNRGSVLFNGSVISRIEHLPSDAEIALRHGSKALLTAAEDGLQSKIADLTRQLEQLRAGQTTLPPKSGPDPWPAPPPGQDAEMAARQVEAAKLLEQLAAQQQADTAAQAPPLGQPEPSPAPAEAQQATDPKQAQRDAVMGQPAPQTQPEPPATSETKAGKK